MNNKHYLLLFLLAFVTIAEAQVVDRYPYIQRPSQTTATIAWRRATAATGKLYLGSAPNVWFDSLSTTTLTQEHAFDLAGLQPDVKYYYQVKSVSPSGTFLSAVEHFYTAPLPIKNELSFLAYGDCGYNNTTQHTIKALMETQTVDFAIVTGDVDQGNGDDYDNVFFGVYKDMLKKDCHFTCIGNHDTYADNAATYLNDFYLFSNNAAQSERYYSFEWGEAKFICLDGNIPYTIGSAQHDWMLDEMRCHDSKWLIIFFHQPPWTNAWSIDYYVPFTPYFRYQGDVDMRTDLVPYFEQYNVDFVVNGHSHCYQRGEMNGVQYLITGGAGSSSIDNNTNSNAPNISVEIYENHYVRFDIKGDTAKYVMINDNNIRKDSVAVIKNFIPYQTTAATSAISCSGAADGSISLTTVGSRAPYTYLWSTGATTATINNLSAGIYTVTISDVFGCPKGDTFAFVNPVRPTTQINTPVGTLVCDASPIALDATGNYPQYLWSTGATTASLSVAQAGQYSVTAYDANGCPSMVQSVLTTAENTPVATFQQDSVKGLSVYVNAPTTTNNVRWDFGDGMTATNTTVKHDYQAAGVYTIKLVEQNACGADSTTQLVTVTIPNSIDQLAAYQLLQPKVQPNPFSNRAILSFNNDQNATFEVVITDVQGKQVHQYTAIKGNQVTIEKADLSAGTYFYTLENEKVSYSGKIIIK